jgi:GntR family transcriptional regulator / MocR family aminotransferase
LQLRPGSAPARNLTAWLTDELRSAIADGRLAGGALLPSSRVLAADLGVSRGTVVEAYRRIQDEGLVGGRSGAGTTVRPVALSVGPAHSPWTATTTPASAAGGTATPGTATPGTATPGTGVPRLPRPWRTTAKIDLSPGVPDLSAFPRAAWLRAERAVLAHATDAELGYGDPRGSEQLRQQLSGWLARVRGLRAGPEDIVVVAGVAQALALLSRVLRHQGLTAIAVEDPGSRGARDELAYWGMHTVPVGVDQEGARTDDLVGTGCRVVLLTPAHQFPTGVVLSPERRRALLRWAAEGGLVIEDDYDAEYRYDRAPVPAFQASAPDRVAYTGSTSKSLAPGLRLGWLVAPRHLHDELVAAKHASDLGNPSLPQLVLARLIATGDLDRHIRFVRGRLRARRDVLLAALLENCPQAHVQGVAAGLHLVVTFPTLTGVVDDADLAARVAQDGVLTHPLSLHRHRDGPPGLVLGYAAHSPGELRYAAGRIGLALVAKS